jgi:predicted nucleic acid-binding protein
MPRPPLPKNPIIDTNILFDFLVWRFHNKTQTDIHPSLHAHLSTKPLEAFEWYLDAAKPVHTTFHVIAEIQGLMKKRTQKNPEWTNATRDSFWRFTREELSLVELREHPVTLAEMDPEVLAQLGPTDASILVLAIRLDAIVLTEDGGLRKCCSAKGVRDYNYQRVLELWEQSAT